MADLSADLRDHLLASQEIRHRVGDRIYPDTLPQEAMLPAIVIEIDTDIPERLAAASSSLRRVEVTFTICAITRLEVHQIAADIDRPTVLGGYRGAIGSGSTTMLRGSRRTNAIASTVAPVSGSDMWEHRSTLFFEIDYSQP